MPFPAAALEADLAALRRAAERAGLALGALASSARAYQPGIVGGQHAGKRCRPEREVRRLSKRAALSLALAALTLLLL